MAQGLMVKKGVSFSLYVSRLLNLPLLSKN